MPEATGTDSTLVDLTEKLDSLLERYLYLLDEYTSARKALGQDLCDGYLSLASANFTTPRRYGQDFYDERMKAQKLVQCRSDEELSELKIIPYTCSTTPQSDEVASNEDSSNSGDDNSCSTSNNDTNMASSKDSLTRDPLLWYGAFISPKLRHTQTHFVSAVDTSIPTLVNLNSRMRDLEIDVRRTRKQMTKAPSKT